MHTRPFYTTRTFYIGMTTVFVLVLATVFITTTRAIRTSINTAYTIETSAAEALTVETEQYRTLKRKLNLPDVAPRETETSVVLENVATTTTTELIATSTEPAAPPLTLTEFTLAIKNGTATNGLAGSLAKTLTSAGFAQAKTSNATAQPITEIYIKKENRTAVATALKAAAPDLLGNATIMETNPTSADIVIILGGN